MSLDDFARCPVAGCDWAVYAPFRIPTRCRIHGGQPDLPQVREADIYGNPQGERGRPSTPAPRALLEA